MDLGAVGVEGVDQIARMCRCRDARADADDREGPVRQVVQRLGSSAPPGYPRRRTDPLRRQTAKGLPSLSRWIAASPACAIPFAPGTPEQVVEAAVLQIEHEDVGQPVEPARRLSEHRAVPAPPP